MMIADPHPVGRAAVAGQASPLLDIRDLALRFGGIVALDGVSFALNDGEILGLIGPNGAGKTTLFNCISRLYTPNRGDILFAGSSLLERKPHRIAEIGIARTFQNLALFGPQSVLDNVRIGGHARGRGNFLTDALLLPATRRREAALTDIAWDLLDMLDLREFALRPAAGLPLGTRKRVELARAGRAAPPIVARRAGGRASAGRGRRAWQADPAHPRRAPSDRAAGRAPHATCHVRIRSGRRARFRPQDRRGHAGRDTAEPGRDRGVSRDRDKSGAGRPIMIEAGR
jgi:ABC-type branched-subunit amino acid transport system ATPase component